MAVEYGTPQFFVTFTGASTPDLLTSPSPAHIPDTSLPHAQQMRVAGPIFSGRLRRRASLQVPGGSDARIQQALGGISEDVPAQLVPDRQDKSRVVASRRSGAARPSVEYLCTP